MVKFAACLHAEQHNEQCACTVSWSLHQLQSAHTECRVRYPDTSGHTNLPVSYSCTRCPSVVKKYSLPSTSPTMRYSGAPASPALSVMIWLHVIWLSTATALRKLKWWGHSCGWRAMTRCTLAVPGTKAEVDADGGCQWHSSRADMCWNLLQQLLLRPST